MSDIKKVVRLAVHAPNPHTVELAQQLLRDAESGRIQGFTAVIEFNDNTYNTWGSPVSSRTATAGMLLDAAMTRLDRDRGDE